MISFCSIFTAKQFMFFDSKAFEIIFEFFFSQAKLAGNWKSFAKGFFFCCWSRAFYFKWKILLRIITGVWYRMKNLGWNCNWLMQNPKQSRPSFGSRVMHSLVSRLITLNFLEVFIRIRDQNSCDSSCCLILSLSNGTINFRTKISATRRCR